MPDSQWRSVFCGSNTNHDGRFMILAEHIADPSAVQVAPPSRLAQTPAFATPAMSRSSSGFVVTCERFPHSDFMLARLAVALFHDPIGCAPPVPTVLPPPVPAGPDPMVVALVLAAPPDASGTLGFAQANPKTPIDAHACATSLTSLSQPVITISPLLRPRTRRGPATRPAAPLPAPSSRR